MRGVTLVAVKVSPTGGASQGRLPGDLLGLMDATSNSARGAGVWARANAAIRARSNRGVRMSVLRWLLCMVDDENFHGSFLRLEPESKLFLQGCEDGRE